jgi:phage shock protein A
VDPTTITTIVTAILAVIGGQVGLQVLKILGDRHKEQRESSKQDVDNALALSGGWEALYKQALARIDKLESTITQLQNTEHELHAENVSLKARVAALESEIRG